VRKKEREIGLETIPLVQLWHTVDSISIAQ